MSSTHSHASTGLDRKALKRPDELNALLQRFFDGLSKRVAWIWVAVALLAVAVGAGTYWHSRNEAKNAEARNALFLAQQDYENELKDVARAMAPPKDAKADASQKDSAKADAKKEETPPPVDQVFYKPLDVAAKFPKGIAKLQAVAQDFKGTRAGFEALLTLGGLYLEHGNAAAATPWFERAVSEAPDSSEKAAALISLGTSFEDQSKYKEALQAYQKALGLGQAHLKGQLMLSSARMQELLGNQAQAKTTYDQIITQMPSTEAAKDAETAKAQLD